MPDIAFDLDFIILASTDNCQWSRYQRDLVDGVTIDNCQEKLVLYFTYRVLTPDIAFDLDFIILASPDNCQWSRYQRDLVANTTLYSLL